MTSRITLHDPSDEIAYLGAVCNVARVEWERNAGSPVFHLYGEDGRYLAGFNAAHVALTPDDPDFEIPEPELLAPSVPLVEKQDA